MKRINEILFVVKFEDGQKAMMTTAQIAQLKDRRKYEVLDARGKVILRKTFRGI